MARSRPRKLSDSEAEEKINKLMLESGDRDKIREKLKEQLSDTNWREAVKLEAKEILAEKGWVRRRVKG